MRYKTISIYTPTAGGCVMDEVDYDTQAEVITALGDANVREGQSIFWAWDNLTDAWFFQQTY